MVQSIKSKLSLLFALVVPLLISGPFLPDLIVSLSSIFFLYYLIKNKKIYRFNVFPIKIFLIFYLSIILSSLLSENIFFSLKTSLLYFRFVVFACLIWFLIDEEKSILNYFYYLLVISFSILSLDAYYQYFNQVNILGLSPFENNRISSLFGKELILGSYLTRLFPLLFALFVIRKNKKTFEIWYIGVLFIAVDVLVFITGERTAFFLLNLSTIFIICLIKDFKKFRIFTFTIGIIFCLILTFSESQLQNRMISGPLKSMGLSEVSKEKFIFSPSHDSLIRTAFKMFLDKPILGHGPKMFRLKCSDPKYVVGNNNCSTHPHNFYAQLLAETGVTGFSFLASIFFYIIFCFTKQIKSIFCKETRYLDDYQVCLLGGILITVWPFVPNGNFFNNWLSIVYFLPAGFYLQSIFKK
jgi:O-antigen ligase